MAIRLGKKKVGFLVGTENLNPELNNQDRLLTELETDINDLPNRKNGEYNIVTTQKDETQELAITDYTENAEHETVISDKPIDMVSYNGVNVALYSEETEKQWKPNPTWWDIESIYNNDTAEYTCKAVLLLQANVPDDDLSKYSSIPYESAFRTSDGAFYDGTQYSNGIPHIWDETKDKPCLVNGEEIYKTRYVIVYSNSTITVKTPNNTIYTCGTLYYGKSANSSYDNYLPYRLESICNYDTSNIIWFDSMFANCFSLKTIPLINTSNGTNFYRVFIDCHSLQSIPLIDTSKCADFSNMFSGCHSLQSIPLLDTSNGTNFSSMFFHCYTLQTIPLLNTSKGTNFSQTFYYCYSLQTIPLIDTSNATGFSKTFYSCRSLQTIPLIDTSNATGFNEMFYECRSLMTIPLIDTSKGIGFSKMFMKCHSLQSIPLLNTSKGTNFSSMFDGCHSLQSIQLINTSKGANFSSMFYGCRELPEIVGIDLLNATNVSSMFANCSKLKVLLLKNIKISLTIGSGTTYGHLLTLDSLLNTIKELWTNTGTSTLTLTVGSANLSKLANVYVKLIDVTDEMRAEDQYIDNKKPFEVCESTDTGAMLITEYVTSKNWQLA